MSTTKHMHDDELTTNTPPASVTPEHVAKALQILGLGFDGLKCVSIFTGPGAALCVDWIDDEGRVQSVRVAVRPPS